MGSSLIVHGSSMVEQTTVNRSVEGSNPSRGVPLNILYFDFYSPLFFL